MVLVYYRAWSAIDVYRVKMEALDAGVKSLFLEVPEHLSAPRHPKTS